MNDETQPFGLACRTPGDAAPVLTGVRASGRLDGVLFDLTLRQTYRNTSDRGLEVVYTFPLPLHAVLLGFASELNGARKVGHAVARRAAERRYEEALAEGDAPVLIESLGGGLHTANIGNLQPGDTLVIEFRFAQRQVFEQGRLRLAIPTTIAPRFGSACAAGLQPQQVPPASLRAEYPLALSVVIAGTLADGTVECPTHAATRTKVEGGLQLDLTSDACLDRDVVIVVTPVTPQPSVVIQARDTVAPAAPVVLMAALQPRHAAMRAHIALKLLVDCSGSMGGESIASARRALLGVLAGLTERDEVSISRFGSSVAHLIKPSACTPNTLRRVASAMEALEADLGGTEMRAALTAVFDLRVSRRSAGADVLLVTDGEIWQAQPVIDAARASGHRVFAIGVGSSPAEDVLRSLVEATGGACEFATPGEALEAAARRMLERIRQQPWRDARIDWGCDPVWQTPVPTSVFGGDTVLAFAGVSSPAASATPATVRLLAVDATCADVELARGEAGAPAPGDTVPRVAAARRMATVDDTAALDLALAYQLTSRHTHYLLVHPRTDADRAAESAALHLVPSMLAAGWGATATVRRQGTIEYSALDAPTMWRSPRSAAPSVVDATPSYGGTADADVPAFLRKRPVGKPAVSLEAVMAAVVEQLSLSGHVQGLHARCAALELPAGARRALDQAIALGLGTDEAWLILAHWVNTRSVTPTDAAITTSLKPYLDAIDATLLTRCMTLFDRILRAEADDRSARLRVRRLWRAMTGSFS